jgi:hypothetical protein
MGLWSKLFGKKTLEPVKPKLMFANCRWGVVTAYFQETLEELSGGMVAPRAGIMLFTDDETMPRTGTKSEVETVARETGRELRWVSEYSFYTIGRGCVPPTEDIGAYGHLVCPSVASAVTMSAAPPR